jgi:hypothetical protein
VVHSSSSSSSSGKLQLQRQQMRRSCYQPLARTKAKAYEERGHGGHIAATAAAVRSQPKQHASMDAVCLLSRQWEQQAYFNAHGQKDECCCSSTAAVTAASYNRGTQATFCSYSCKHSP